MLTACTFITGGYKIVQRKVPEFIVPDLQGFEVGFDNDNIKNIICHFYITNYTLGTSQRP